MDGKLPVGFQVKTILGGKVTVKKHIGEGGQGDVYIVDYNGETKALKWYKEKGMGKKPQAFYDNIKNNAMKGAPSPEFLWPLDVTDWHEGVFGYIMGLKPDGYYEITDFMVRNATFTTYKTAIDAVLKIVSAFRILHNLGYSYQDLNDGNFFINPKNGKVLICDNDNVAPNGTETGIKGKPRYMAPEIVLDKKMPDNLSDRFSMSLIIFILFCLTHPLEGKRSIVPCLTPSLQKKLYGSDALFIMDPDSKENAPDKVVHKNVLVVWPYLPNYMQDLFQRAFSQKALQNPNARPKELDWINALVRFRSEIVRCRCGNEVFTKDGSSSICEKCKTNISIKYKLTFSNYSIPALHDSRIYRCQLGVCDADEALNPVGRVMAKKDNPSMLGIRNLSGNIWNATTSTGASKKVMSEDVIPLKAGISFVVSDETIKIEEN